MSQTRSLITVILQFFNSLGSNNSAGFGTGGGGGDIDNGVEGEGVVIGDSDEGGRRLL